MNRVKKVLAVCFVLSGCLLLAPALAASGQEDGHKEALQSMIKDIETAIQDADQRMVAHPSFLDELRVVVERYKAKIRAVFLSDDFQDGNFKSSPKWTVDSGYFMVTRDKRLRSQVNEVAPSSRQTQKKEVDQGQEVFNMILKGVLDAATENQTQQQVQEPAAKEYEAKAVIKTKCSIPAAFEVDVSFKAEPSQGAMEMILMGGSPARNLYRLIYHASPSPDSPIQLIREKGGRSYVIDMASDYPMLEDGSLHRIQWTRDLNGNMLVLVDGKTVVSTVELFYREPFSGFALANQGGIYEWDSVRILQPLAD